MQRDKTKRPYFEPYRASVIFYFKYSYEDYWVLESAIRRQLSFDTSSVKICKIPDISDLPTILRWSKFPQSPRYTKILENLEFHHLPHAQPNRDIRSKDQLAQSLQEQQQQQQQEQR